MENTNKVLAVKLACAVIRAMGEKNMPVYKPITGDDISNVLRDCYAAVSSLDEDAGM